MKFEKIVIGLSFYSYKFGNFELVIIEFRRVEPYIFQYRNPKDQ